MKNRSWFLIDDDSELAEIVEILLRRRGDSLTWAGSIEEALPRLPAFSEGVLILDVNLPGISGIDWLRQKSPRPEVAMFVQSQLVEDLVAAWEAGANYTLFKECITHPTRWNSRLDEICLLHQGGNLFEEVQPPKPLPLADWLNPALHNALRSWDSLLIDALVRRCIKRMKAENPEQAQLGVQYGQLQPSEEQASPAWASHLLRETASLLGMSEAERVRVALDRSL